MVIALAAIIPILYLLLRDTKVKVFLKPTEFQELPLEHKEVSMPSADLLPPLTVYRSHQDVRMAHNATSQAARQTAA